MAFTTSTVENLTVVNFTTTTAATNLYIPSPAGDNRFRFRVIRVVYQGATGGDSVTMTGITNTKDDSGQSTETQTLFLSVCTQGAGPAAVAIATIDTVSFPDEAEVRGRIQIANTLTSGSATMFIHHG